MAFVIAKTEHPGRNTFLLIPVLAAMQLDMVIRLNAMMVILGDNGLINQALCLIRLINCADAEHAPVCRRSAPICSTAEGQPGQACGTWS